MARAWTARTSASSFNYELETELFEGNEEQENLITNNVSYRNKYINMFPSNA